VVLYLCQVNGVNGGDTVFVRCVAVRVSVRSGAVNETSLKLLKLWASNLTCMLLFPGLVDSTHSLHEFFSVVEISKSLT